MTSSPQNCIFTDNYNRLMDDYFDVFIVSLVKIANGSSQASQDRKVQDYSKAIKHPTELGN